MYLLFEQAIRRKGEDALTLLNVVAAPNSSKEAVAKLVTGLQKLAGFSLLCSEAESVYDHVDDETHVRLIGSCLATGGTKWLADHARQADWLRQHGVSPDEAIERFRAWLARRETQLAEKRARHGNHDHIHEVGTEQDGQRPGV